MKPFVFLVFFASLLPSLANFSHAASDVGEYEPIDIQDPIVSVIAQFAVSEHNHRSNSNLTFFGLITAEKQLVAGTNYRLVLEASDGGIVGRYETVVYQNLAGFLKLTTFHRASIITGAYFPIDVNLPIVSEIAQFTVSEHNHRSNSNLTFVKVIKADQQLVAGMNYRLVLEAKDGGIIGRYETVVYQNLAGVLKLTSFQPAPPPLNGGYFLIDVHLPIVSEVAQFAVSEQNHRTNFNLRFVKVIQAEEQIVAGSNYRLVLEASDGKNVGTYQTVVYQNLAGARKLTYFHLFFPV